MPHTVGVSTHKRAAQIRELLEANDFVKAQELADQEYEDADGQEVS
jgi:hypothetical protein